MTTSRRLAKAYKKSNPSRTRSSPARLYIAIPPTEGWPGGDPLKNGYRPSGSKK